VAGNEKTHRCKGPHGKRSITITENFNSKGGKRNKGEGGGEKEFFELKKGKEKLLTLKKGQCNAQQVNSA